VLAFEPRRSDLPLQVAFPILIAHHTGEFLGSSTAPAESGGPGAPVSLTIPDGASGLSVTRPDGATTELVPGTTGGGVAVTYAATDLPGIYTVTPIPDPETTPEPSASAGPSGIASPTASPTAASAPPTAGGAAASAPPPEDPLAPVRFTVALFDVDESTTTPGSATDIESLGTPVGPGGGEVAERPSARDELWVPVVLVVLALLLIEWTVYHRDAAIRLRRGLAVRLGRDPGAPA
jgi:hypothetical protein